MFDNEKIKSSLSTFHRAGTKQLKEEWVFLAAGVVGLSRGLSTNSIRHGVNGTLAVIATAYILTGAYNVLVSSDRL